MHDRTGRRPELRRSALAGVGGLYGVLAHDGRGRERSAGPARRSLPLPPPGGTGNNERMSDSAWASLLERVRADTQILLAEFLTELAASPGYADSPVPPDDLERTALQAFEVFLGRLADSAGAESAIAGSGSDPEPLTANFPESLGRRRARQGVPLPVLSEGVRINFRLLWRALHRAAQPDLVGVLAQNGERVITVVEGYATEVQAAYLDEAQILALSRRTARERAVARLFSGSADTEERDAAAATLGIPADGELELLAVERAELPAAVSRAKREPGVSHYEDGDLEFLFRLRRGSLDWPLAGVPIRAAYVSRVHGIQGLASAARLARKLREAVPTDQVVTLRSAFPSLVGEQLRAIAAGFEDELLGGWSAADDSDRERLRETVEAFLHSGSVKEAGEELFLHRNTVFKRLRAFENLTGLDVTVPRDACIALVLFAPGYVREPDDPDPLVASRRGPSHSDVHMHTPVRNLAPKSPSRAPL